MCVVSDALEALLCDLKAAACKRIVGLVPAVNKQLVSSVHAAKSARRAWVRRRHKLNVFSACDSTQDPRRWMKILSTIQKL
jgi:hypothetical protein